MITALIGLLGVVLGAMLSALVSHRLQKAADERRWEREDRRLYHPERIEAYKAFTRAVTRYTMASDLLENDLIAEHLPDRVESTVRLLETYSDAYTFASPAVENEARRLLQVALGGEEDDIAAVRLAFLEAVNHELGLPQEGSGAPTSASRPETGAERRSWWQRWFGG